jgi:hypothetical protein
MAKASGDRHDAKRGNGKDSQGGRGKGAGRKGGDGRRGPAAAAAPRRVEDTEVLIERRDGVRVLKRSRVDVAGHRALSTVYLVAFDGREPIEFPFLSAARERAKEPPPELPVATADARAADGGPPGDQAEAA